MRSWELKGLRADLKKKVMLSTWLLCLCCLLLHSSCSGKWFTSKILPHWFHQHSILWADHIGGVQTQKNFGGRGGSEGRK